jgi:hypothetical protein
MRRLIHDLSPLYFKPQAKSLFKGVVILSELPGCSSFMEQQTFSKEIGTLANRRATKLLASKTYLIAAGSILTV